MFIYSIWDKICQEISKERKTITVNQILEQQDDVGWIAIKHDVETNVPKALALAKIEAKYGIKATYYVQADLLTTNNRQVLKDIAALGHEVTYHYDVLDANNGDIKKAIKEFSENVSKFKDYGFKVETVCPHGNPVMVRDGWTSNKDFFRNHEVVTLFPNILDMVVQLPSLVKGRYTYISDAGYGWKEIVNIQDNDLKNDGDISIKNHLMLLNVIKNQNRIILSTHPHRWEKSKLRFFMKVYVFKILRFSARRISSIPILKRAISKYYYLAKKV